MSKSITSARAREASRRGSVSGDSIDQRVSNNWSIVADGRS
jgi:hypothetical protein